MTIKRIRPIRLDVTRPLLMWRIAVREIQLHGLTLLVSQARFLLRLRLPQLLVVSRWLPLRLTPPQLMRLDW